MQQQQQPHVVSVQSHICFGHIGNSAAVFPMQFRGVNVTPVHTLQFSTEPLYSCGFSGEKAGETTFRDILQKLSTIARAHDDGEHSSQKRLFTHILSGYIGCANKIEALASFVKDAKIRDPDLCYACDLVVGDGPLDVSGGGEGKLYVAPEVMQNMKRLLLPLADIVFPNFFEATTFGGDVKIVSHATALQAAMNLHRQGPSTVVITSYCTAEDDATAAAAAAATTSNDDDNDVLNKKKTAYCLLSMHSPSSAPISSLTSDKRTQQRFVIFKFDVVDGFYSGTGDLIAALVLSEIACKRSRSLAAMEAALMNSLVILNKILNDTRLQAPLVCSQKELRVIPNRNLFLLRDSNVSATNAAAAAASVVVEVIRRGTVDVIDVSELV